jgi:hypothetical protein
MGFDPFSINAGITIPPRAPRREVFTVELLLDILPWLGLIPVIIVLFALLFLLVQQIREVLRFAKVNRMPVNDRACAFFRGILKITDYYNYPIEKGETLYMYCKRLGRRFTFKSDSLDLHDLVQLYYKACYGAKPITENEMTLMRDCYYDMVEFLRRMRRAPHYLFLRYVRRVTVL